MDCFVVLIVARIIYVPFVSQSQIILVRNGEDEEEQGEDEKKEELICCRSILYTAAVALEHVPPSSLIQTTRLDYCYLFLGPIPILLAFFLFLFLNKFQITHTQFLNLESWRGISYFSFSFWFGVYLLRFFL